jgi:hypothetical protein
MILASAGIGAAVSATIQLLGTWRERTARRREMLLKAALDMAAQRTEIIMRASDKAGSSAKLYDNVFLAERYFQWLLHLEKNGQLPEDAKQIGHAQEFYN